MPTKANTMVSILNLLVFSSENLADTCQRSGTAVVYIPANTITENTNARYGLILLASARVGTIEPCNSFMFASIPSVIIASATEKPIAPTNIPITDSLLLSLSLPIEVKNPASHNIQNPTYENAANNQFFEALSTSTWANIVFVFLSPSGFFIIAAIPRSRVSTIITGPILLITSTIFPSPKSTVIAAITPSAIPPTGTGRPYC